MTQKQWAALWIREGGDPGKADLASAVVMAESGGNAKSTSNPCCKGGYQINVEVGNTSLKCALNPSCATKWSIKQSQNGTNWSAWEAYTNGSYQKYVGKSGVKADTSHASAVSILGDAALFGISPVAGVANLLGGGGGIPNPLSGIDQLGAAVEAIARLIEHMFEAQFWVRTGKGLLGALLIGFALQGMAKATLGVDLGKIAMLAATKGKA
jgi:hypothetical protein